VDSHEILTTTVATVATTTHGRVLTRQSRGDSPHVLVGFHGYYENADIQMTRLAAIPGADAWTLVAVQGLHRFYRARTDDVVASWMTRQDRELAIADNIAYVDAAVGAALSGRPRGAIVCAGFSQGVAMAFRAAVRGAARCAGVIAAGGDVPPELLADPNAVFPPVLLIRGAQDDYYPQQTFDGNVAALRERHADVAAVIVNGAHDWTAEVSDAAAHFLRRIAAAA
jgi:predicted esterase